MTPLWPRGGGWVLGSDAAGMVVQAAAEGSGPAAGVRVVALTPRAFVERVAVQAGALAEVPPSVDLAQAAALPVAGVAALRALRAAGAVLGKRVLVTGASGGVGRFAVQLAAQAGAHVIASVGSAARGEGLAKAGADEVLVGLDGVNQPVDVVLDNVGGAQLVTAWELLAPGGSLQSIGWASGEPAVFPPYSTIGPPKSLTRFSTKALLAASWPLSYSLRRRAGSLLRSAGAAHGSRWPRRPRHCPGGG